MARRRRCNSHPVIMSPYVRGHCILDSYPGRLFGAWVWIGRRVKTTVMKVAGGTDKTDRGVQFLITEPALMLRPSPQPAPSYDAPDANQSTDEHGQEV